MEDTTSIIRSEEVALAALAAGLVRSLEGSAAETAAGSLLGSGSGSIMGRLLKDVEGRNDPKPSSRPSSFDSEGPNKDGISVVTALSLDWKKGLLDDICC